MTGLRVVLKSTFTLALFVSCAVADVDRGVELYRQDKYSEAETELRTAVEQDDSNARAHRYLGLALLRQDKLDDASRQLTKANEIESSGETKTALAWLYIAQKDFSKAESTLAEASGEDLEFVRGLLRFYRKQHVEAAEAFEADLKDRPDNAYSHYYAGMAYSAMNRPDKMLTHFELFLRARPDAPEAKKVRAVLKTVR